METPIPKRGRKQGDLWPWWSHTGGWTGPSGNYFNACQQGWPGWTTSMWEMCSWGYLWINNGSGCHPKRPRNRRFGFRLLLEKVHFPATWLKKRVKFPVFGGNRIFNWLWSFSDQVGIFYCGSSNTAFLQLWEDWYSLCFELSNTVQRSYFH